MCFLIHARSDNRVGCPTGIAGRASSFLQSMGWLVAKNAYRTFSNAPPLYVSTRFFSPASLVHPLWKTTLRLANTPGYPWRIRDFHTLDSHTLVFGHLQKICIFELFQQLTLLVFIEMIKITKYN